MLCEISYLQNIMEGSTSAKRDVFHAYCTVMSDGKKLKCNCCEKEVSAGISRFKMHLAQQRGTITPCMHVPLEIKNLAKVWVQDRNKNNSNEYQKLNMNIQKFKICMKMNRGTLCMI